MKKGGEINKMGKLDGKEVFLKKKKNTTTKLKNEDGQWTT
jgi:hypothetical protein